MRVALAALTVRVALAALTVRVALAALRAWSCSTRLCASLFYEPQTELNCEQHSYNNRAYTRDTNKSV